MDRHREERLKDSWAVNAEAWTSAIRGGGIESRALATDAAVLDAVVAFRPQRVLDVGTGEGWLAHRLAERGIEVVGFDASEELISRAREGPGSFHVLDYDEFTRAPDRLGEEFDVAVCNFSLLGERVDNLLRGVGGVLAPGGRLVIQTLHPLGAGGAAPYADGWREEDFRGMAAPFGAPMPWFFRTIGSWVEVLRSSGFQIDECREPTHPGTSMPLSLLWVASR